MNHVFTTWNSTVEDAGRRQQLDKNATITGLQTMGCQLPLGRRPEIPIHRGVRYPKLRLEGLH